jgi:hypothetical protein
VKGTPNIGDNDVFYGDNGGTLTITIAGGAGSTNYTVDLTCDPPGRIDFASSSVTLAGGASQTVALSGRSIGDATITATEHYSAASSASKVAHVIPKVAKIEYQLAGSDDWRLARRPITVPVGATVAFKAIPLPSTGTFPSGEPIWSGTSGASGTGDTTTVQFNTASPAGTSYTVTATCGNSVTMYVICVNVQLITRTEASTPDGSPSSRTTVGVGEIVDVTLTPTSLGHVTWSLAGGGELSATKGNPIEFTAPGQAANPCTITANCAGLSWTVPFNVIPPAGETATVSSINSYLIGTQGVGFVLAITVTPTNVSFHNVSIKEQKGTRSNITGVFKSHPTKNIHHPNIHFTLLDVNNQWSDTLWCQGYPANEWSLGHMDWTIPVRWAVNPIPTAPGSEGIPDRTETFDMAPDGTTTLSKLGRTVSRSPSQTTGVQLQ